MYMYGKGLVDLVTGCNVQLCQVGSHSGTINGCNDSSFQMDIIKETLKFSLGVAPQPPMCLPDTTSDVVLWPDPTLSQVMSNVLSQQSQLFYKPMSL